MFYLSTHVLYQYLVFLIQLPAEVHNERLAEVDVQIHAATHAGDRDGVPDFT